MKKSVRIENVLHRLSLDAETAADLMTPQVLTIPERMTVKEAAAFLTNKGVSGVPVVDALGQPVGVLSRTDIVKYDYEKVEGVQEVPDPIERRRLLAESGEVLPVGFHEQTADETPVENIMTPVVFSVAPQTPVNTVIDAMLSLGVHRLFVIDAEENVIGVISALDILRHLCE